MSQLHTWRGAVATYSSGLMREEVLRTLETDICEVTRLTSTQQLHRVEYVTLQFHEEKERWTRRSLSPADRSEFASSAESTPEYWMKKTGTAPVTSVDVWDGLRLLSVSRTRGGWSGSLLVSYKPVIRRGALRAGVLPGEIVIAISTTPVLAQTVRVDFER
jgi:hypothetical protein